MKRLTRVVFALALAASTAGGFVSAQETKPATPKAAEQKPADAPQSLTRDQLRERWKTMTPEQRQNFFRPYRGQFETQRKQEIAHQAELLGVKPEDVQSLPPEERIAKLREASDKKLVELQKKKLAGPLTSQEQQTLAWLEARKQRMSSSTNAPAAARKAPVVKTAEPPKQ